MTNIPQSSSTLQNYISSGSRPDSSMSQSQEQSNLDCQNCQKITKIQNQSSSSSSSGDDGQLVQPLHRHIVQHSRQIQTTIFHLQSEIQKLKKGNETKDIMIQQLKKQLKELHRTKLIIQQQKQQEKMREAQFLRRQEQVQKLRKQLIQSSQKAIKLQRLSSREKINDSIEEMDEMKKRLRNIQIKFQDRKSKPQDAKSKSIKYTKKVQISSEEDSSSEISSYQASQENKKLQKDKSKKEIYNMKAVNLKQKSKKKTHQIGSQEIPSLKTLNDQIQSYIKKIQRLQSHIMFCEEEMLWMTNFIISFIKMADKFMNIFKQPVIKKHWTLKKKTKIAWQYTKHLLAWFVTPS